LFWQTYPSEADKATKNKTHLFSLTNDAGPIVIKQQLRVKKRHSCARREACGEVKVQLHPFCTSTLLYVKDQLHT